MIDAWIDAWNAHDAVSVVDFMTDDVEYLHWWDGEWKTFRGRDTLIQFVDALAAEWSSAEEAFAVEYVQSGTSDRGEDATGKPFAIRSAFIGKLSDGKISRVTDYAGLLEYSKQMT